MSHVASVSDASWVSQGLWVAGTLATVGALAYAVASVASYFFEKKPQEPRVLPPPVAVVAAPAEVPVVAAIPVQEARQRLAALVTAIETCVGDNLNITEVKKRLTAVLEVQKDVWGDAEKGILDQHVEIANQQLAEFAEDMEAEREEYQGTLGLWNVLKEKTAQLPQEIDRGAWSRIGEDLYALEYLAQDSEDDVLTPEIRREIEARKNVLQQRYDTLERRLFGADCWLEQLGPNQA
jgi:hypothetical protein